MRDGEELTLTIEDLRLVATITRAGSVQRARAGLNGHVSTIYRHLRTLEARLGGPLFEQRGGQLVATARAIPLLEGAEAVREHLSEIERRVAALDDRLVGPLHVTTADSLCRIVSACLREFELRHPGVSLSLTIDNRDADLGRREADVAIRPTRSPPETLIGRRAAIFDYAAYRTSRGEPGWIVYEGEVAATPAGRRLSDIASQRGASLRVNTMVAAAAAAAEGYGTALIPTYLGEEYGLERTGEPFPDLASELWVLFHADLRTAPRVRQFAEFASAFLRKRLRNAGAD